MKILKAIKRLWKYNWWSSGGQVVTSRELPLQSASTKGEQILFEKMWKDPNQLKENFPCFKANSFQQKKMVKNGQNGQNDPKWSKMVPNGLKSSKMV